MHPCLKSRSSVVQLVLSSEGESKISIMAITEQIKLRGNLHRCCVGEPF